MQRYTIAQAGHCATAIFPIERLAARLAGGFYEGINNEFLYEIVPLSVSEFLGEFDAIKSLPGFSRAAMGTLLKAWQAGLNFETLAKQSNAPGHARFVALAALEAAVLKRLPAQMLRPQAIVDKALERMGFAPRLFGEIDIIGHTELSPVWRPLLIALDGVMKVRWIAGPRSVPQWVYDAGIQVVVEAAQTPQIKAVSCANPQHEALEALRWARELIVSGRAEPADIAIAAASLDEWDDHLSALSDRSDIPLYRVQGRSVLTTREGQFVAALADIMVNGVTVQRITRFIELLRLEQPERFPDIESNWMTTLSPNALTHSDPSIQAILRLLDADQNTIMRLSEQILGERAYAVWQRALARGPVQSMSSTLKAMRVRDDAFAPECSIIWTAADALAAAPRRFVRLLGVHARSWPRAASEDSLIPEHVVPALELDPLPLYEADRHDFATIIATTENEVVCSRSRRNAAGKTLGTSPLFPLTIPETFCQRSRIPNSALSKVDRSFARPKEFAETEQARRTQACWRAWHSPEVTAYDGKIRADHPLILRSLQRRQSASSLKLLLCDPLGYVWKYAFRWSAPEPINQPLTIDALTFGTLLHALFEQSVHILESSTSHGWMHASESEIQRVLLEVSAKLPTPYPPLPYKLWQATLTRLRNLSIATLQVQEEPLPEQKTWVEVPFGGSPDRFDTKRELPWDTFADVILPGSSIRIGGFIDRLDLSADGMHARVTDYKSGTILKKSIVLGGGHELQRALYAYAVKILMPQIEIIESRLQYPRSVSDSDQGLYALPSVDETLAIVSEFLVVADANVRSGNAFVGNLIDADRLFALPSGAATWYMALKKANIAKRVGQLAELWEME